VEVQIVSAGPNSLGGIAVADAAAPHAKVAA
jgi:hypothetical protein